MIVIIDYGMGNLGSIANMFKKIGVEATVSGDAAIIESAEKLILPGVGAFDNGMRNLAERGFLPLLNRKVVEEKTPILGICLGMQLLTNSSEEGKLPGLGWIDAQTVRFHFGEENNALKIPHMGWNAALAKPQTPLFSEMTEDLDNDLSGAARFYFVHSYHVVCNDPADIMASTFHGYSFTSAVRKNNIMGVQFHPEKSHRFGMTLLKNFAFATGTQTE